MIYYLVPDNEKPSWGVGIIYHHVSSLVLSGFSACIVKSGDNKVPNWLKLKVPVLGVSEFWSVYETSDSLVVPEVMVGFKDLERITCKKILFVQAGAFLFESMPSRKSHKDLGFAEVIVIMPHLQTIVEKYLRLPTVLIPPFVAEYFFCNKPASKKKQILIYPKFEQIDYSIVTYLLSKYLDNRNKTSLFTSMFAKNWKLVELKGMTHREVARTMHESEVFISLNAFEALNTSVVEAMASKVRVFCYEGFGPRDYLIPNVNAFVVANNEPYLLFDKVVEFIESFDNPSINDGGMIEKAFETANDYKQELMVSRLIKYYGSK
jgi:glycosyltransferase involved in cell wall biosynthesis